MNVFRMSAMSLMTGIDKNSFQHYIVWFVQCWGFLEKFQNSLLVLLCWQMYDREFLQLSPRWKYSEFSEAACVIKNVRGTAENQWLPAGPIPHRVLQLCYRSRFSCVPGAVVIGTLSHDTLWEFFTWNWDMFVFILLCRISTSLLQWHKIVLQLILYLKAELPVN